jgi:hypothetical protein
MKISIKDLIKSKLKPNYEYKFNLYSKFIYLLYQNILFRLNLL